MKMVRRVTRFKFFSLLIFMACSIVKPCSAADSQKQGFQYMQEKNYAKALECFDSINSERRTNWQLLQNIGNCHMHLGQYEKAIGDLQKSIEAGGLHSSQCTIMAAALEGLGQPKKALNWLNLACSVEPAQASNPGMQAAIKRLNDPAVNPTGAPNTPDYLSGLVSVTKWRKQDMPLKVHVRKNIQIPEYYEQFLGIVRTSLDQWCAATGAAVSYKFVSTEGGSKHCLRLHRPS